MKNIITILFLTTACIDVAYSSHLADIEEGLLVPVPCIHLAYYREAVKDFKTYKKAFGDPVLFESKLEVARQQYIENEIMRSSIKITDEVNVKYNEYEREIKRTAPKDQFKVLLLQEKAKKKNEIDRLLELNHVRIQQESQLYKQSLITWIKNTLAREGASARDCSGVQATAASASAVVVPRLPLPTLPTVEDATEGTTENTFRFCHFASDVDVVMED